jgi:Spy/CpxP family protein refolding chaperone
MTTTTVAMTESTRPFRPRLLAALLAISLALNFCFIGGAVWTRLSPPQPLSASERFQRLGQSLNLTPQQQVAFDQYVSATLTRGTRVRQATEPLIDDAWAEIAKPDPDQAKIQLLLDNFSTQRREVMHEAASATLSFLATLTPEQKSKFLAEERDRRTALRRRRAEEAH